MAENSFTETSISNKKDSAFSAGLANIMRMLPKRSVTYTRNPGVSLSVPAPSGGGYGANITSISPFKKISELGDSEIRQMLNDMAQKGEGTMKGKNTLGDRNNNPLNIKWTGADWQKNLGGIDSGVKASDGGSFVKFPDADTGFKAAEELIKAPSYMGLTVDQALRRWSGASLSTNAIPKIKEVSMIKGGQGGIPDTTPMPISQRYAGVQKGTKVSNLGVVTTPYGGSTREEKVHPGIDIANQIGTPVPAFEGGKVVKESLGHRNGERNGGNQVVIQDGAGNTHQYSHLNDASVKVGQTVQPGEKIGNMGNTGASYSNSGGSGSHLDYRITDAYGKYKNPLTYIKKYL